MDDAKKRAKCFTLKFPYLQYKIYKCSICAPDDCSTIGNFPSHNYYEHYSSIFYNYLFKKTLAYT